MRILLPLILLSAFAENASKKRIYIFDRSKVVRSNAMQNITRKIEEFGQKAQMALQNQARHIENEERVNSENEEVMRRLQDDKMKLQQKAMNLQNFAMEIEEKLEKIVAQLLQKIAKNYCEKHNIEAVEFGSSEELYLYVTKKYFEENFVDLTDAFLKEFEKEFKFEIKFPSLI